MDKLTDPDPYHVLGITPDADRKTIKQALAASQRKNKSQADRQQALQARNALVSTEKRLIADTVMPSFLVQGTPDEFHWEMTPSVAVDWREIADPEAILRDDLEALIMATIQHTLGKVSEPERQVTMTDEFDGLDDFINEWLKK